MFEVQIDVAGSRYRVTFTRIEERCPMVEREVFSHTADYRRSRTYWRRVKPAGGRYVNVVAMARAKGRRIAV